MPIDGAKYRFKKTKGGKAVRLAFVGNKVVEATPFKRGAKGKLVKRGPSERITQIARKLTGR